MSKKRWGRTEISRFAFFLLLIALGWAILARMDYIENPLQSIRSIVEVYQILQANPGSIAPVSTEATGLFTEFDWAMFPDVLYNVWFICLMTAGVMITNRLVVRITRFFKTKN